MVRSFVTRAGVALRLAVTPRRDLPSGQPVLGQVTTAGSLWWLLWLGWRRGVAEPGDLFAELGLAIQPGPGHPGGLGELADGDRSPRREPAVFLGPPGRDVVGVEGPELQVISARFLVVWASWC